MRPEPPPPDCQQHYLRGGLWSRGAYSLNYERVLFRALKERLMLSASFGASYYSKHYCVFEMASNHKPLMTSHKK